MSTRRCLTFCVFAVIALVPPLAGARAQGLLTIPPGAVSVVGAIADHRVDTGLGLERAFGPLFGAQLDVEPDPRIGVSLRALGGTLDAKLPGSERRSVGELALSTRLDVLSLFRGNVSAVGRSYTGALARQHWSELSLGGEGHAPLIDGILDASLGLSLAPVVRVTGRQAPDLAVAGLARLRHSGERLDLSLGYSLERYDFPVIEGTRRVEEISMLTLRAGLRFGRRSASSTP
jgi:hypothetical protein